MELLEFNAQLSSLQNDYEIELFIKIYFLYGTAFVFNHNTESEFDFKNKISNEFKIPIENIYIVGSSKLGFSYHKQKKFDFDSDIDIAIVNNELYEKYFEIATNIEYSIRNSKTIISIDELKRYNEFKNYLIIGWMRPDKLPLSYQVSQHLQTSWFHFFESLSNNKSEVGNYKVAAGIFKNHHFLIKYLVDSLLKHKKGII